MCICGLLYPNVLHVPPEKKTASFLGYSSGILVLFNPHRTHTSPLAFLCRPVPQLQRTVSLLLYLYKPRSQQMCSPFLPPYLCMTALCLTHQCTDMPHQISFPLFIVIISWDLKLKEPFSSFCSARHAVNSLDIQIRKICVLFCLLRLRATWVAPVGVNWDHGRNSFLSTYRN